MGVISGGSLFVYGFTENYFQPYERVWNTDVLAFNIFIQLLQQIQNNTS